MSADLLLCSYAYFTDTVLVLDISRGLTFIWLVKQFNLFENLTALVAAELTLI